MGTHTPNEVRTSFEGGTLNDGRPWPDGGGRPPGGYRAVAVVDTAWLPLRAYGDLVMEIQLFDARDIAPSVDDPVVDFFVTRFQRQLQWICTIRGWFQWTGE